MLLVANWFSQLNVRVIAEPPCTSTDIEHKHDVALLCHLMASPIAIPHLRFVCCMCVVMDKGFVAI